MRLLPFFAGTLLSFFSCHSTETGKPPAPSAELQKALDAFQIADGFRIELVAAEPLVADPVAMEVDEDGRLYVVEMHGYPLDTSGTGLVKLLEDTDGDGYPDRATVFADSLVLPTGIMRWREGVLVTDPPHVWYLEDSNGDGRADIRRKMLSGFARSNPQHNLNNPLFGPDNWIYLAHQWAFTPIVCKEFSDEGSAILFPDNPQAPRLGKNADDRNVRFKPDTYEIEALAGETQFGQTFDPWCRHFLTENADHIYTEVLAAPYIKRNPNLLIPEATENISDHGDACEVFPVTEKPDHQLLTDVGVITSACGITWYAGGAFPEPYLHNTTFVAEPVHNLVHADKISENGASFKASRILEQKEFLASKDAWFRPVNFYIGPEGALYVVDYYRQIIEHPEWMSDEVNRSGALYNGADKGRIYRIVPEKGLPMNWMNRLDLSAQPDEKLAELLENQNIWQRRTAQRLLFQRRSKATEAIEKVALHAELAEARVHALWLLEGLGSISEPVLMANLQHSEPGVRENALKIAELHLAKMPGLAHRIVDMAGDPSPRVRFQVLNTLGAVHHTGAAEAKIQILNRDMADRWVQLAAIAASPGQESELLLLAEQQFGQNPNENQALFFNYLAATIANSKDTAAVNALLSGHTPPVQAAIYTGLKALWANTGVTVPFSDKQKAALLSNFRAETPPMLRRVALELLRVTGLPPQASTWANKCAALAVNQSIDEGFRIDALYLLSIINPGPHRAALQNLVKMEGSASLRLAALQTLGACPGTQTGLFLTENWLQFDSILRDKAIDMLLESPERCHNLLDAISRKKVTETGVGWRRTVRLMNNDDTGVRTHARRVLASTGLTREAVLASYQPALNMPGNFARGEKVFDRACRFCHQINGKGVDFGPDLSSLRNRPAPAILKEIIIPNTSIADKCDNWRLELKNGQKTAGIISAKTATTVTLKQTGGQSGTYARSEIFRMEASDVSAMPNGLEAAITVPEMADLLAFIKNIQ